jgi:hypothetical protein
MLNIFNRLLCCLRDAVGEHGKARHATDDFPVRRIRSACWVSKATDTHEENVTLITFPRS